ncbi:hypothetical protein VVD49_09970 [Uliginosibacterium sp. H3]|uniref:Uncharacterized protein n=1 Tax=Uliginosibacterium silvisoli TaxID=3114758 RepID=A0ABU6K314_9RHOO|nr:hypothetical protein [Uliginosibacterium sp. H3]
MSFLMRNLGLSKTRRIARTDVVSAVLLDVRAYGFSSAVSALMRDLRQ